MAALAAGVLPGICGRRAWGQDAAANTPTAPAIEVSTAPPAASGIDRATLPSPVQTLGRAALTASGTPDVLGALAQRAGGVSLSSAAANPFQPSLFYHGFEISPLQGTPQGLAVYVDGVRFNQPFGDTVNWDLLPEIAIRSLAIQGANPAFGLNALGGGVEVRLKDGFNAFGGEAELAGGSFGRVEADLQYARRAGNTAAYVAASERHEGGWRNDQSSDIQNLYGDLGWRSLHATLHASITLANAALNGPGTVPVQLLALDPAAQYTAPNYIGHRYAKLAFTFADRLDTHRSLRAIAYYDYFREVVANGNAPNDTPCFAGAPDLCSAPGVPSTTFGGAVIPNFRPDGHYSELDRQTTDTNGYGGSVQLSDSTPRLGFGNRLVAGLGFDGARTAFGATALIGGITPLSRVFIGPGVVIDEPGGTVPVSLMVTDAYYGLYLADTLDLTRTLSLSASARANVAAIDLADRNGGALTGRHVYVRVNPALGAIWQARPLLSLYAGYSEANRAPTPAELSCAGPADACSLANFFVGDPNLKQVVAHTLTIGLRGTAFVFGGGTLRYDFDYFHSMLDDDITLINAPTLGRAYFANVGKVLRQGVDLGLRLRLGAWRGFLAYSRVEATYRTRFVESAGGNPYASANGTITVLPGAHLPGIPENQIKAGLDYQVTRKWRVGITARAVTTSPLFGDAANLAKPAPGYVVADLTTSYRITPRIVLFGTVENITDTRYYTYGTFTQLGTVAVAGIPNLDNPRSYSIAAPIGGFVGLRARF